MLSVFSKVVNLKTNQGWCITLAPSSYVISPNRILVPEVILGEMDLRPGDFVEIRPALLRTERGNYELDHSPMSTKRFTFSSNRGYRTFEEALGINGVGAASAVLGAGKEPSFPESIVADRALRLPEVDAAAGLLGLGSGYTPSGDDILAGYLVASVMVAGKIPDSLKGIGVKALDKTTPLSATMIRCAELGLTSDSLELIIRSIARENKDIFHLVSEYVETVGHSSGSDTLLGVYLALSRLLGKEQII